MKKAILKKTALATLAISIMALLCANSQELRAEEYEFPTYDQPKKKASSKKAGGKKKTEKKRTEKQPDFLFPQLDAALVNQCDFDVTEEVAVAKAAADNSYAVDLADLTPPVETLRRLECRTEKGNPLSAVYVVDFELREGSAGGKAWQAQMISGSLSDKDRVKVIFDQFVDATWISYQKALLKKLSKNNTARVFARHFKDGTSSIEVSWTENATPKPKKQKKNVQAEVIKPVTVEHSMFVIYSADGYEMFRKYDSQKIRGSEESDRDVLLDRTVVYNKDLVVSLSDYAYAKDNPLADERSSRVVSIVSQGIGLAYSSTAIDGNKNDRTFSLLKTSLKTGNFEPAIIIPTNISVDTQWNNIFGWLKEITLELSQEGKVARVNLAGDELGKLFIDADQMVSTPWFGMTKETSDSYVRKIYSRFQQ